MMSSSNIREKLLQGQEQHTKASPAPVSSIWLSLQFYGNILETILDTGYTSAILITDAFALEEAFLKMSWLGFGVALPIAVYFSWCESRCHDAESRLIDRVGNNKFAAEPDDLMLQNQPDELKLDISSLPQKHVTENKNSVLEPIDLAIKIRPIAVENEEIMNQLTLNNKSIAEVIDRDKQNNFDNVNKIDTSLDWKQHILTGGHYTSDVFSSMQKILFIAKMGGIDNLPAIYRGTIYGAMGLYGAAKNVKELQNTITSFKDENSLRRVAPLKK